MGSESRHATLSASDALAQARADGFVRPTRDTFLPSYECDGHYIDVGPPQTTTGRYADYVHPSYAFAFSDRRVHVARIAIRITVFPDAATAARCARASIYAAKHIPLGRNPTATPGPTRPYKLIDSTTVETYMHPPGQPGEVFPDDTGQYETFLARGRVFAQGVAYNEPHSRVVREDLERIAEEVGG
jgi:hypothetical protein